MKVRATLLGYYNHKRRRPGEVFDILDEKAFSQVWMEKAGTKTPARSDEKMSVEAPAQSPSEEVI